MKHTDEYERIARIRTHERKRKEAVERIERIFAPIGISTLPLSDVSGFLPENPEWKSYVTKKRQPKK